MSGVQIIMSQSKTPLKVAILASEDTSPWVLKSIIETNNSVQAVEVRSDWEATETLFSHEGFNCLFIDIFSVEVEESIRFIEDMRDSYHIVPICLYSKLGQLAAMPGVSKYWRARFEHYFKLPSDQTPQELRQSVDNILHEMAFYLQTAVALDQVGKLAKFVHEQPDNIVINKEQRDEIEEIVEAVQQALKNQDNRRSVPISIVPGVSTSQIEQMVNETLREAKQSLQLTTRVNIGVLLTGLILTFSAFIFVSITGSQSAVWFGGFGTVTIFTALITNPLRSISSSANRIVQIQVAYFEFLSQLRLLSQDSDTTSIIEKSKRLEDAMERTVRVLGEHGQ